MAESQIRIGTSGWHYPGRGTAPGTASSTRRGGRRHRPPGFDELEYYARHFDTVEVNSTFYGVPRRSVTEAWAGRTPDDFAFAVKLYQQFTHPKVFAAATGNSEDVKADRGDVERFRDAIAPLHEAGKLGALLAQFPASFKNDPARARSPGLADRRACRTAPWRWSCGTGAGATTSPARCGF